MMKTALALCSILFAAPVAAQVFPTPNPESPRIQSAIWQSGEPIVLTALPETTLTTMLEPGERIERAVLGGSRAWEVSVSAEADSFQVTPSAGAPTASLSIETNLRLYEFTLETGVGLQAAYVVRLQYTVVSTPEPTAMAPMEIENLQWSYRLRGDRSVRPSSIRDNGEKTVIEYAPEQPLPAVFAIGASGDEEVVTGYMRGDKFIIDRVHDRLVFRIDKEKATARRNPKRDDPR
ncbi:TrbG/VirB9 family P-type conjugative transfer protein [Erythrobacter sp. F6033]|uniref:TrbG/VirB9 family P-type conjugative transfer protein n=1 Tax=Erythrobacter sp. F6033 TaxID=2926401 RepID=UPI001FF5B9BD|nr:TrbG/VirB9 family P-type conjugative transfer protein [Erythrobacter sp. F6033]MCK0127543.1 TrbG/VirB9 family P-type conjugative transfer protein [Erythrobacter sp. F6033]